MWLPGSVHDRVMAALPLAPMSVVPPSAPSIVQATCPETGLGTGATLAVIVADEPVRTGFGTTAMVVVVGMREIVTVTGADVEASVVGVPLNEATTS